ncbi:MAG: hypothetical protein WCT39_04605 [Candidatus Margulisiibacteriota bacterium]
MEPGGIGSADRLPARAYRPLRPIQSKATAPTETESVRVEIPITDSAHISIEARALPIISQTVAEGQQRALDILEAGTLTEGSGLPESVVFDETYLQAQSTLLELRIALRTNRSLAPALARCENLLQDHPALSAQILGNVANLASNACSQGQLTIAYQLAEWVVGYNRESLTPEEETAVQDAQSILPPQHQAVACRSGSTLHLQSSLPAGTQLPTETLPISDPGLRQILQSTSGTDRGQGLREQSSSYARQATSPYFTSGNYITTVIPARAGEDEALKIYVEQFISAHPAILEELNITDITQITPQQAITLASRIVGENLNYTDDLSQQPSPPEDDMAPLDILQGGRGVCRHYAFTVGAVFNILKYLYPTQLRNSYAISIGGRTDDLYGEFTTAHEWNMLFTQVSQDEWGIQALDPSNHDTFGTPLDITFSNTHGIQPDIALTLFRSGTIDQEQTIHWVEDFIRANPNSPRVPFAHWIIAECLGPISEAEQTAHLQAISTDSSLDNNASAALYGHDPLVPEARNTATERPLEDTPAEVLNEDENGWE